jgi:hypothetical protein
VISNTPRLFCARSLTSSDDGIEPSCSRVFNAHIPFSGVDHHSIMADVASTERQRESADQEGREKGKRMDEHRLASVVIRCFAFLYLGVIAYLIVIENTHSICPSSCMCWERETPRGQMMQQKKNSRLDYESWTRSASRSAPRPRTRTSWLNEERTQHQLRPSVRQEQRRAASNRLAAGQAIRTHRCLGQSQLAISETHGRPPSIGPPHSLH